jgi:hypothetical protein
VQDSELRPPWLRFAFDQQRIYAPLEHAELPSQLSGVTKSEASLLKFAATYGRLGWYELCSTESSSPPWLRRAKRAHGRLMRQEITAASDGATVYAEPIEWIESHSRTVAWCMQAGRAVTIKNVRLRRKTCEQLAQELPKPTGTRASIETEPLMREAKIGKVSSVDFVGKMLQDYLWINLKGVRRRVEFRGGKLHALWGGDSLLESIYTMVTDAITGGRLAQCHATDCGAVFVQTDERQQYCPPRDGQEKSTCMNRERVRRFRNKGKMEAHAKAKRTR